MADDPDSAGPQASVSPPDLPKLTVQVPDDVTLFVDGELIEPGDTVELDFPTATNLVAIGHGAIVAAAAETKKGAK